MRSKSKKSLIVFIPSIMIGIIVLLNSLESQNKPEAFAIKEQHEEINLQKDISIDVPIVVSTTKKSNVVEDASLSTALELHKEWSIYPPNSRPLDDEAIDLIHPNYIEEPLERPIFLDDANNIRQADFSCRFQPLQHRLTPNDKTLELQFYCLDGASETYDVEIKSISGKGENPNRNWTIRKDHFSYKKAMINHKKFTRVDGWEIIYKNSNSNWGDISVTLEYKANDQNYKTTKYFVLNNREVGRFTNQFRENLVDGSLIIEAEVDIFFEGWYRFDSNLKNDESYIATASYEGKLQKGKIFIPFMFFGKLFHNKQATGPYIVESIRGHKITYPVEEALELPPEEFEAVLELATYEHPTSEPLIGANHFETKYYDLDDFSNQTYTSEKNLNHQEELIDLIRN